MDTAERASKSNWLVVLSVFLTMTFAVGAMRSYGVFIGPLFNDFGWSYASLSLPVSVFAICYGLMLPFVGTLTDKYGVRRILVFGVVIMGLAFLGMALTSSLLLFILFYGVLGGMTSAATGPVPASVAVVHAVKKNSGRALGLATSGMSIGPLLLMPLTVYLISSFNWRTALLVLGLALLAVNVPLILAFVKEGKREERQKADSDTMRVSTPLAPVQLVWQALRTRPYLLISAGYFGCGFTVNLIYTHFVVFAVHSGFPQATATLAFSLLVGMGAVGTILVGSLADRMENRILLSLTYLSRGALYVALLYAVSSPLAFYLVSLAIGAGFLATIPLVSGLIHKIYGGQSMGLLVAVATVTHQIGGAIGAFLGGFIIDASGSYLWAFIIASLILFFSSAVSIFIPEKERHKFAHPALRTGEIAQ